LVVELLEPLGIDLLRDLLLGVEALVDEQALVVRDVRGLTDHGVIEEEMLLEEGIGI